jgi:hypothetical protein
MEVHATTSPVREILDRTGNTLRGAAEEIGMNYQSIYLADCGCYVALPPRLMDWLCKVSGYTELEIGSAYHEHKKLKRMLYPLSDFDYRTLPPVGNPVTGFREKLSLSRSKFCKRYCVPATVMYSMEASATPIERPSGIFIRAIRDADAPRALTDEINKKYLRWRRKVA